jgi:hypothetical protein
MPTYNAPMQVSTFRQRGFQGQEIIHVAAEQSAATLGA